MNTHKQGEKSNDFKKTHEQKDQNFEKKTQEQKDKHSDFVEDAQSKR